MFSVSQPLLLDTQQHPFYVADMRLGGRLKKAREKRGFTQEALATKASTKDRPVSQAAISALEKRDSETTIYLFQFARALQVRPEWLQDGIEPDEPSGALTHRKAEKETPSDAEKLFLLVRAFLDTDEEGKDELAKAVTSITEAHGTVRTTQPRRAKRR